MVGAILLIIGAFNPKEFSGDYFLGCGISTPNSCKLRNDITKILQTSSKTETIKLISYLYKNSKISLMRKYKNYLRCGQILLDNNYIENY